MAHFPKPAAGSWTENWPELGTAPVNYEDSIDPEHYKLEQQAIFKKTWLNVGRVERLPKKGSYFTREMPSAGPGTSVIIVKDKQEVVRAFYNMCRHRGNKLVWSDYPGEEVSGTCRQFTCKYHAWRYSLEGDLTFVQQEGEFFDLDKANYGLVPVHCEVWEGFVFINFDDDAIPLTEYLGDFAKGLEGYPFHEMTEHHGYRSEINANWKLFIDAFVEFYHAPILHMKQAEKEEAEKLAKFGFEALAYDIKGDHSMVSSWGGMSPPKDLNMVKPIERILHSGLFGPWDRRTSRESCQTTAAGYQPGPSQDLGHMTLSSSSPTSRCCSGRRVGTSPTITGLPRWTSTSSRPTCTSCHRRTPASASRRSWQR